MPVLRSFDHAGVRLLPGRYRDQVMQAAALYGGLDEDAWLKGFRRQAGMATPGEDLKGWASATSSVVFGQIMGGLARLGRATGDAALTAKARRLFAGWRATLGADGNARMRLYDWEKVLGGLLDLHEYADEPEALAVLRLTSGWAEATFDRSRVAADGHGHFVFSYRLYPWDHAPGWLLHREAGGFAETFAGKPYDPMDIYSGLICAPDREGVDAVRRALLG